MKKYILATFAFMLFFTVNVAAQTDDEFDLMQRAEMVAEIKNIRSQNVAKDKIIEEKDAQISTYKQLNAVQEARIGDLKEALKYRTEATDISTKVENMYKDQIAEYRTEMNRLRDENEKLRKSRDRRGILGIVTGLIGGALLF